MNVGSNKTPVAKTKMMRYRSILTAGGLLVFPLFAGCQCIIPIPPFPDGVGGGSTGTTTAGTGGAATTTSTASSGAGGGTAGAGNGGAGGAGAGGSGGTGGACTSAGDCTLAVADKSFCPSDVTPTLNYQGDGMFDYACFRLRNGHALKVGIATNMLICSLRGGVAPGPPDPESPIEIETGDKGILIDKDAGVQDVPLGAACVVPFYCEGDSQGAVVFLQPTCD